MGFFRKKSDDDAIKDAESSLIEKPVEVPEPGPTPWSRYRLIRSVFR